MTNQFGQETYAEYVTGGQVSRASVKERRLRRDKGRIALRVIGERFLRMFFQCGIVNKRGQLFSRQPI